MSNNTLPDGFGYVDESIPSIKSDLLFYSTSNFTGTQVVGYFTNRAILTLKAIESLKNVQTSFMEFNLGVKIIDAYRPVKGTQYLVNWIKSSGNVGFSHIFFPKVTREEIINYGYVAKKSEHNRGSALDMTLISLDDGKELDMGSICGLFDEISHLRYSNLTSQQRANRMLLYQVMCNNGFKSFETEWWHFRLSDEPFPDQYFDFDVR
jgi:D-alanyl-D-alanine dipeptidase